MLGLYTICKSEEFWLELISKPAAIKSKTAAIKCKIAIIKSKIAAIQRKVKFDNIMETSFCQQFGTVISLSPVCTNMHASFSSQHSTKLPQGGGITIMEYALNFHTWYNINATKSVKFDLWEFFVIWLKCGREMRNKYATNSGLNFIWKKLSRRKLVKFTQTTHDCIIVVSANILPPYGSTRLKNSSLSSDF